MMSTSVPMRTKLQAQEKVNKHRVTTWCTNITQKSFRCTSKNCEKSSER